MILAKEPAHKYCARMRVRVYIIYVGQGKWR